MVFIVIQLFSSFNKKAGVHAWESLSLSEEEMGSFHFSSEIKYWFLLSVGTATSSGGLPSKQGHLLSSMVESQRGNDVLLFTTAVSLITPSSQRSFICPGGSAD